MFGKGINRKEKNLLISNFNSLFCFTKVEIENRKAPKMYGGTKNGQFIKQEG